QRLAQDAPWTLAETRETLAQQRFDVSVAKSLELGCELGREDQAHVVPRHVLRLLNSLRQPQHRRWLTLRHTTEPLTQKRLNRIEPDSIVGKHDLVPTL